MLKIFDLDDIINELQQSFHNLEFDFLDVRFHDTADPITEMDLWEQEVKSIWERLIKYAAHKNENIFYQYQTKDINEEEYFLFKRSDSPLLNLWVNDFIKVINYHLTQHPQEETLFHSVLEQIEEFSSWQNFEFKQPHHIKPQPPTLEDQTSI